MQNVKLAIQQGTDRAGTFPTVDYTWIEIVSQTALPAPTLASASPNTGTQGQSNLAVTLAGSNFLTGPTCGFGVGITVNSCTFDSSTQLMANISIAANATVGSRNITVTNTDGQIAALTNGFSVVSRRKH